MLMTFSMAENVAPFAWLLSDEKQNTKVMKPKIVPLNTSYALMVSFLI